MAPGSFFMSAFFNKSSQSVFNGSDIQNCVSESRSTERGTCQIDAIQVCIAEFGETKIGIFR